jgi:inhibitor of cysteine peptidase
VVLIQLTEDSSDRTIELNKGDTVELCLPEVPASDYRWRWRLPEGLRMVTDERTPGQRRLAFDVNARGEHELRAELARPWESEAQRALTFTVHVE